MIITNSRYALVGYFITSYPTQAHGIIVIYLPYVPVTGLLPLDISLLLKRFFVTVLGSKTHFFFKNLVENLNLKIIFCYCKGTANVCRTKQKLDGQDWEIFRPITFQLCRFLISLVSDDVTHYKH